MNREGDFEVTCTNHSGRVDESCRFRGGLSFFNMEWVVVLTGLEATRWDSALWISPNLNADVDGGRLEAAKDKVWRIKFELISPRNPDGRVVVNEVMVSALGMGHIANFVTLGDLNEAVEVTAAGPGVYELRLSLHYEFEDIGRGLDGNEEDVLVEEEEEGDERSNSFQRGIYEFFRDAQDFHSLVTLDVKGEKFLCHLAIISEIFCKPTERSPVFRAAFSVDMTEKGTGIYSISGFDPAVVHLYLKIIYGDTLERACTVFNDSLQLWKFCREHLNDGLKQAVLDYLPKLISTNMSIEELWAAFKDANELDFSVLEHKIVVVLKQKSTEFVATGWMDRVEQETADTGLGKRLIEKLIILRH